MRIGWRRRAGSRSLRSVAAVAAAVVLAGALLAGCSTPASGARGKAVVPLTQISTLRSLFNRDYGHVRLILILSPT